MLFLRQNKNKTQNRNLLISVVIRGYVGDAHNNGIIIIQTITSKPENIQNNTCITNPIR